MNKFKNEAADKFTFEGKLIQEHVITRAFNQEAIQPYNYPVCILRR